MQIHILTEAEAPWGDYGHILWQGMADYEGRKNGNIQLYRTGPFIPPITFPGIMGTVVTTSFRKKLERSGLTGFTFRPVIKKHIVWQRWEKWDRTLDDPPEFPESGEPEDYVLEQLNSVKAAEALGDLWEVCPRESARVKRVPPRAIDPKICVIAASWNGMDWFRAKDVGYDYISERAKKWLAENVPEWVSFESVQTV